MVALSGPNGGGILQVNGTFNHRGASALTMEIGGTTPGTGYSRVSVRDASFLFQGLLNYSLVNGFTPTTGSTFDILTGSSIGGSFSVASQPGGWANPAYLPAGAPATLVRLTAP